MPAERRNTAHEVFLQFHRHRPESLRTFREQDGASKDDDDAEKNIPLPSSEAFDMFHRVMKTGVI